jgi:hypothetical protein
MSGWELPPPARAPLQGARGGFADMRVRTRAVRSQEPA